MPAISTFRVDNSIKNSPMNRGYSGTPAPGFVHEVTKLHKYLEPASELLPRVHRVISLSGDGSCVPTKEPSVTSTLTTIWRFNRRKSKGRGKLFFRLAQQAVAVDPVPYDLIIRHEKERNADPNILGLLEYRRIPT
jgi:hypothetical protein